MAYFVLDIIQQMMYIHIVNVKDERAKTMTKHTKKRTPKQATPLAAALRENILKSGFSHTDVSKAAGIDYWRLRNILRRNSEPSLDEANQLQHALKTLIDARIAQLRDAGEGHLALS